MSFDRGLQKAVTSVPECIAAGFIDLASGMLLGVKTVDASLFGNKLDADRCAAMRASLPALAERVSEETLRGDLHVVVVQGEPGIDAQPGEEGRRFHAMTNGCSPRSRQFEKRFA